MHILCPHCRSPIEVVELSSHKEIACPSCGSSFRLEGNSTTDWKPGILQKLGRFELLEEVGHGAFGTVYKARDVELDRTVAVKVPRAGNLPGDGELDRFLREARSVAQLRHPSIITVHEVGQHESVPYLVSDFVAGVTLADLLSARRPSPREAAEIIVAVADALHYAHQQGVIHRDVKPSNIMLEKSAEPEASAKGDSETVAHASGSDLGSPRIMDFGLAKRETGEITMTVDGQVLGTPAYMAPEQARGESHRVDGRSDVYSLGVILYQMLTGELPFRGTTRMLLHQVLHDEPRPPRSLNDRIPRDLQTICLKAMAKEPARRYASAAELAADLRRFLEGRPISARPVSRAERVVRWCRRQPALAGLIAAVIAVTALGFAGTLWQKNQALDNARLAEEREKEVKKQRDQLRRALYAADMNLISAAWEVDNVPRVLELLDKHIPKDDQPDLRGFEWYYWKRQCHSELESITLEGKGHIWNPVFSPDGSLVAGAEDGKEIVITIWNARTGKVLHRFPTGVPFSYVNNVVYPHLFFSPEGKRLAAAVQVGFEGLARNFKIKIWDVQTGHEVWSVTEPMYDGHIALGPGGKLLATTPKGSNSPIKIWDTETGKVRFTLAGTAFPLGGNYLPAVFHPQGKCLTVWTYTVPPANPHAMPEFTIKSVQLTDGKEIGSFKLHDTPFGIGLAFSPDGNVLGVYGFAKPGQFSGFQCFDPLTGKKLSQMEGKTGVMATPFFSPDGEHLACHWGSRALKIWETATGQFKLIIKDQTFIDGASFTPGSKYLLTLGTDRTVKKWDLHKLQRAPYDASGRPPEISPDGRWIAIKDSFVPKPDNGSAHRVQILDSQTAIEKLLIKNCTAPMTFDPDGEQVAVVAFVPGKKGTHEVMIWDIADGKARCHLPLPKDVSSFGPPCMTDLALSAKGRYLAARGENYAKDKDAPLLAWFKVWDTATGQEIQGLPLDTLKVNFPTTFSPDGEHLVGSQGDALGVWHVSTGKKLFHWQGKAGAIGLAFSPDGKSLAAGMWENKQSKIYVWDLITKETKLVCTGHDSVATGLCFSPDGRRLASLAYLDNEAPNKRELKLWDTESGQEVLSLTTPGLTGSALHFSKDGHRLFCAKENDASLQVWDATPLPGKN